MNRSTLDTAFLVIGKQKESARRNVMTSSLLQPYVTLQELERDCANGLEEILESTIEQSVRYAISVAVYMQALTGGLEKADELAEANKARKQTHDATMDSINALSRALKQLGQSNQWIGSIAGNRAAYGKFALLLAFEKMSRYEQEAIC